MQLLLDTDVLNEIDDQFALAYLLLSVKPEQLDLITIAPFSTSYFYKKLPRNIADLSENEILKIGGLLNQDLKGKVIKNPVQNVEQVIGVLEKNDRTTLICNAALSNIARVFDARPELAKKCEVIWLGGNNPFYYDTNEFNLCQDPRAVRAVLSSDAAVTVVPAWGSASHLYMPISVSERFIKPCGQIGEYLHGLICKFDKGNAFDGKKLWDIATVATFLFKDKIELFNKTLDPKFRDIKVKTFYDVSINPSNGFTVNEQGEKPVKFVVGLQPERIFNDFIGKLQRFGRTKSQKIRD